MRHRMDQDERVAFAIRKVAGYLGSVVGFDASGIDSDIDASQLLEGFEDRVLTGFFKEAPQALWPRAVVIEHLSSNEWQNDCIADMRARGYAETGKTRSNTLLVRG